MHDIVIQIGYLQALEKETSNTLPVIPNYKIYVSLVLLTSIGGLCFLSGQVLVEKSGPDLD